MDVKDAIKERRAYRSLEPIVITQDMINELAASAQPARLPIDEFVYLNKFSTKEQNKEK